MSNIIKELRIPDVTFADVMRQMRQNCPARSLYQSAVDFIDLMAITSVHCKTQKHKEEVTVKIRLAALLTGDHTRFRRN